MLTRFDWLRRSRTGPELLATLRYLEETPELPTDGVSPGPPPSAWRTPCARCWVYPPVEGRYCATCREVLRRAWRYRAAAPRSGEGPRSDDFSRSRPRTTEVVTTNERMFRAVIVWGFVSRLPRSRPGSAGFGGDVLGMFVQDERRFMVALPHDSLKPWLQELVLYHGAELKGLLQIFPTTGGQSAPMGDMLSRIIHQEAHFPPDKLRVRFHASVEQVFNPRPFEREGVLTFEVSEFLRTMDLAAVFATLLRPDERKLLYRLLHTADSAQSQLYWGRFLGMLSQEARDMLVGWGVRAWSPHQASLLYELVDYVAASQPA